MRKQTKLAVVLAAAALLAVGSASLVSAAGWVQEGAEWRYQDASGDYVTDTMKKSGDTTFYLDDNGYMAKDYFCSYNENYYYFGSNGAMVRNTWVAIDPSLVDNADEDVDAYWFYFQETGKAFKAGDSDVKKKKIDGKTYFFDGEGKMLTGWFDGSGEKFNVEDETDFVQTSDTDVVYYCGEDGVARSGWLAYTDGLNEETKIGNSDISDRTTLYFYFNTANFKRIQGKEKTINGKKYRFDDGGVMMTGWEYDETNPEFDGTKLATSYSLFKYYSGEDDGHLVKKGWVYAVPTELIDSEKNYDDEEAYFYFNNNGTMVAGQQKRINGKYYVFNSKGIMKTGLIILNRKNEYEDKIDLEYTDGADFIKRSGYYTGDPAKSDYKKAAHSGTSDFLHKSGADYTIHYYGGDGAKQTGNKVLVEFADDVYTFASKNNGGFTGEKKSKFYSNGFLLKASDDIRLGLVLASDNLARKNITFTDNKVSFAENVAPTNDQNACYVVTTSGSQKKKGAYKDADGNYWLVNQNKCVVGIYNVQVKYVKGGEGQTNTSVTPKEKFSSAFQWKSNIAPKTYYYVGDNHKYSGDDGKDDVYLNFYQEDKLGETQKDHLVEINNDYCLNFTIIADTTKANIW